MAFERRLFIFLCFSCECTLVETEGGLCSCAFDSFFDQIHQYVFINLLDFKLN